MHRRTWNEAAAGGAGFLALALLAASPACAFHRHCRDCDVIPWQWDDNQIPPQDNPPLPQGFELTVPIRSDRQDSGSSPNDAPLNRYREVGDALGRCWNPAPAVGNQHWGEITLRVSFKRNGAVNGIPRVVYVPETVDARVSADLRRSLLTALSQCSPLNFSPSLGNAIAGQIFAIRFTQQGPTS